MPLPNYRPPFYVRQSTFINGCVRQSVGRSVGWVTPSFDDTHVAPYWPTWPCFEKKTARNALILELLYSIMEKNWIMGKN